MTYQAFETWKDVLAHVEARKTIFYKGPFNFEPVRVWSCKVKKDVVRIEAQGGNDPFDADVGHFDRFFFKE